MHASARLTVCPSPRLSQLACHLVPCEWSTLYLEDTHSGKVLYQVLKGGRPSGPIVKVGDGAPGLVSQSHGAVTIRNAQSDPRFTPAIYGDAASRVRARLVYVPVKVDVLEQDAYASQSLRVTI